MDTLIAQLKGLTEQIATFDPDQLIVTYDGDSDIMLLHFYGGSLPAATISLTDEIMVRFDRKEQRIVGLQFDHFLALVVRQIPELIDLLDIAELRDVDTRDLFAVRMELARERRREVLSRGMAEVDTATLVAD